MTFKYSADISMMMKIPLQSMTRGLDHMSQDILNQARMNAPILTGALRASGGITATGLYSRVIGFGVPYSTIREFENNLHPNTKYYLKRATTNVLSRAGSYFDIGE